MWVVNMQEEEVTGADETERERETRRRSGKARERSADGKTVAGAESRRHGLLNLSATP